jgi:hypothetical protein
MGQWPGQRQMRDHYCEWRRAVDNADIRWSLAAIRLSSICNINAVAGNGGGPSLIYQIK